MTIQWKRALTTQFALAVLFAALAGTLNGQNPPTSSSQQRLVTSSPVVTAETREEMGLLTLRNPQGGCSASMLNDYWAITAAHCTVSPTTGTPFTAAQITLTANWPNYTKTGPVLKVVRFPNDIAILMASRHDFARTHFRERKLHDQRPMANMTVSAYGRGINQLAFMSSTGPIPSSGDGQYRSGTFDIGSISPNSSELPQTYSFPGKYGAIVAGGDSGGPSFIEEWDDATSPRRKLELRLIGVHSSCETDCLDGQTCAGNSWMWISSVPECTDAAILPFRNQIAEAIQEVPPDAGFAGTLPTTVPDAVFRQKRAFYALNIDEPLIAPPNAAIDIQLTFLNCHRGPQFSSRCQASPTHELWSYDPATHRVLHVASGKCLNISGARRDAGAPIILYPCSGATNEKWTVSVQPGTAIWTVKSDLTSQCLHAIPGSNGGIGPMARVPTPAKLVQMPCNGGQAQRFANVDADWVRRNGPH